MQIDILLFQPLYGSPGEPLWHEGEASYVLAGRADRDAVTRPPPDLIGFCASVAGAGLVGLQACRLAPAGEDAGVAHGLLSWVRPAYRRMGVFAAIQAAVDAHLLGLGFTAIRSTVVEGPDEDAMSAAIQARGGARTGVATLNLGAGRTVRHAHYLRPLLPS